MNVQMTKLLCGGAIALILGACAGNPLPGNATGMARDGGARKFLEQHNNWYGGVAGDPFADISEATIDEVSAHAVPQVVADNRAVEYWTENGRGLYRAEPLEYNAYTHCRKVREQVYLDGALINGAVKNACQGEEEKPDEDR
jgi:hypothetical protein